MVGAQDGCSTRAHPETAIHPKMTVIVIVVNRGWMRYQRIVRMVCL